MVKGNVMEIQRALPTHPIAYWANHPIFHLLEVNLYSPEFEQVLMYALNSVPGQVRQHLWPGSKSDLAGSADMQIAPLPDMTALRSAFTDRTDRGTTSLIAGLTLSLATNLQAQRSREGRVAWDAAKDTAVAFAAAAPYHPPLLAGSQELAEVLMKRVWEPAGIEDFAEGNIKLAKLITKDYHEKGEVDYAPELLELAGIIPVVENIPKRRSRKRST